MSKIVEDVTRQLKQDLDTALGVQVRIIPHAVSIAFGEDAVLPTFALQGPEIRRYQRNYVVDEVENGTWPDTHKKYDLFRHRSEVDLVFRLRLFADRMAGTTGATQLMEKAITSAASLEHMSVDHGSGDVRDYRVEMGENFVATPTSERSNLKEFEAEVVVEGADLRPAAADEEAHELIDLLVATEKKEA